MVKAGSSGGSTPGGAAERAKNQAGQAKDQAARTAKGAASKAKSQAKAQSRRMQYLGRAGVAAQGVIHLLLAWVTAQVAFSGTGGKSADQTGALAQIAQNPVGKVLLVLLVLGFLAYAIWQGTEAAVGFSMKEDKDRLKERVKAGAKAVVGVVLLFTCARLLVGSGKKSSSSSEKEFTAKLMQVPPGQVLIVIIGLVVVVVAGFLVYTAVTKKFEEKIEGPLSRPLEILGMAGNTARGVVYGIAGILVIVAGVQHDPKKAGGVDAALSTLAKAPFGSVLLVLMALGFAAYGVFQIITCRRWKEG